jgi:hypothetical protein
VLNPESFEAGMNLDSFGNPAGFTAKVMLAEPTDAERQQGVEGVDDLLRLAAESFREAGVVAWLLFDRLDVAFVDSRELEANALRALFVVYLDLIQLDDIRLKIFLRSDIWEAITERGFREASHITRDVTITWNNASLLNLLVRRILQNTDLVDAYQVDAEQVARSSAAQRAFLSRLVPPKVDLGRNPATFEWMLNRVADGSGTPAPRELIHLMTKTRDEQLAMLERGDPEPEGEQLFSRQAFREALPEVGRVRLEQTLFAEYPNLRHALESLRGEKTSQTVKSLGAIWNMDMSAARVRADELVEVGFFLRRGPKTDPQYSVPFLYRRPMDMVQGAADT